METLLRDNGVATFSNFNVCFSRRKRSRYISWVIGHKCLYGNSVKVKDSNKFNLEKTVKRFNELVSSLKMEDEPLQLPYMVKRLADFCTGEMVFKTIYDKKN